MRPLRWWAEEAELLASRLDRWLEGLGHGLGQGYSKLQSSDRPQRPQHQRPRPPPRPFSARPARPRSAPESSAASSSSSSSTPRRNPLRSCAQRLQQSMSRGSRTPSAIVFEKCRPRRSGDTSPSLPAVDIVYYPFRVENCVVCRQLGASAAASAATPPSSLTASMTALAAVPCPQEGCCAPYVPTAQQQASGASGALLFRSGDPPPPPRPVISMSQDYIEVRYDQPSSSTSAAPASPPPPPAPAAIEEQPPPSYQAAMRRAALGVRDTVIGDLALFSPRLAKAPAPRYSAYPYELDDEDDVDDDEETIYSRNNVVAVLEREMDSWSAPQEQQQQQQQRYRPQTHFRSRGKLSSVMYETQRMFEEAFHLPQLPRAATTRGRYVSPRPPHGPAMTRAWSVHGPDFGPAGRDMSPPGLGLGPGLRSLLSIRRKAPRSHPASSAPTRGCCGMSSASSQASAAAGRSTASARPQKKVVVGERGLRGPVWPRVILTFDRGVTPGQAR
ncbi:hypothetical protein ONE63_004127 [Megalurothrips usitatus]|uniref:Uncharacterized protein n=1 Tax=Megalurothrips usitatus TaxID=439358 RepID=A0AAV7X5E6_9NEOP|nr:hypothetical protein ONE63_004127 [Megalurothrips usitatus]